MGVDSGYRGPHRLRPVPCRSRSALFDVPGPGRTGAISRAAFYIPATPALPARNLPSNEELLSWLQKVIIYHIPILQYKRALIRPASKAHKL